MLYTLGTQIKPTVRAIITAVCSVHWVKMLYTLGTQITPTARAIIAAVFCVQWVKMLYILGSQIIPTARAIITAVCLCTLGQDAVYSRYTDYTYCQSHNTCRLFVYTGSRCCIL